MAYGSRGAPSVLHLFDAAGHPLGSLPLPSWISGLAGFAFDGKRLAFGTYSKEPEPSAVVLIDASGESVGRFTPDRPVSWWKPYFASGGKELWLFDGTRRVERYRVD